MAKVRFKNQGGPVTFTFTNGKDPVRVVGGASVSTDDDEVQTAFRKAGFKESSSSKESSPQPSTVSSWRKKEEKD